MCGVSLFMSLYMEQTQCRMGWVLLVAWFVFYGAVSFRARQVSLAVLSSSDSFDIRWRDLRKTLRRSLLYSLGGGIWLALALVVAFPLPIGSIAFLAGLVFITGSTFIATVVGNELSPAFSLLRGLEGRKRFPLRFAARALAPALPIGLTAMLIGAGHNLLVADLPGIERGLWLVMFVGLLVGWFFQWGFLAHLLLPGRLVSFTDIKKQQGVYRIASEMGVNLRKIWIIRSGGMRTAGAFALRGSEIAFTDYLLQELDDDEFYAIAVHELQHIVQRRSTIRLASLCVLMATIAGIALAVLASKEFIPGTVALSLAGIIPLLSLAPLIQKRTENEDDADDVAVQKMGARTLMGALLKVYALNGRLRDAKRGSYHRSLCNRLHRICKVGALPVAVADHALKSALSGGLNESEVSLLKPHG